MENVPPVSNKPFNTQDLALFDDDSASEVEHEGEKKVYQTTGRNKKLKINKFEKNKIK